MKRKNTSTVTSNYINEKCLKNNKFYNFCDGYDGVILNNNIPYFRKADLMLNCFQQYTLDKQGRCGAAFACIGRECLPIKKRENIGSVIPTGWHSVKYDCINGSFLYNRCHLIGFQLTGQNKNRKNIITGTRYFNTRQMLPFENLIVRYIKETGNHVLYKVTPKFKGKNLLAHGVVMEAKSIEDNGRGICFNVYCYNIQPHISIDYRTGDSKEIRHA